MSVKCQQRPLERKVCVENNDLTIKELKIIQTLIPNNSINLNLY